MDNYIYILTDTKRTHTYVIDPAWDVDAILAVLQNHHLSPTAILLTHGHPDHTNGVPTLVEKFPTIPVYISHQELSLLVPKHSRVQFLKEGDRLPLGSNHLEVIETPGHSPGGLCFICDPMILTGDTLFINGCGRADLPGSNPSILRKSLHRLASLPDHLVMFPGHSYGGLPHDTLGHQKQTNPYLG